MRYFILLSTALLSFATKAQKEITLDDIWLKGTFAAKGVYGLTSMPDGEHYTSLETNEQGNETYIVKYKYSTGKVTDTIIKSSKLIPIGLSKPISIDAYEFSENAEKVLLATETDHIYRHSTRENYYVYNLKTHQLDKVTNGDKQMYATLSPDGNKVAFVRNNNFFIKDLVSGKESAITNDGKTNYIINGATDWVYEEEFSFSQAYEWSPDGNKLAYYKFDESRVKEFEMSEYNANLYPTVYRYKYPKAGDDNSIVSIHVYDLTTSKTTNIDIGKETNQYIPRIKWTDDTALLSVLRMNRLQNKLELLLANSSTGEAKIILTEESKTYIEVDDNLTFLNGNKNFIWSSDRDGFSHLYFYNINGNLVNQITKGEWDVIEFKGIDEKTKKLFYTSNETASTEECLYAIHPDGTAKKKLSKNAGTNSVEFNTGFNYYINIFSDVNTPPFTTLHNSSGKRIRILENNAELKTKLESYSTSKKEFFTFKTPDGLTLNGWIMKPTNFDATEKHPVLLTFYGGPGHNEVINKWGGNSYMWHNLLTQKGYIVACVDNRGTERRGRDFKKCTYKQLGKLETEDQIEVAKYLGGLTYVDKTRIGVQGWSFGGYLSLLCMTKGVDYFKTGIAVAPVTNWRFYDSIYTERYLSTPQENPEGYDDNSPINFADMLKGKLLLIHGSADDNVHLQNTIEMSRSLIKANKPFEQFIYPDKNHGIYGGNTRLHLYTKMTNFIVGNL